MALLQPHQASLSKQIELVIRLRADGFSFFVLPRSFIIHFPHPRSSSKRVWDGLKRHENDVLLEDAKAELDEGGKVVKLCKANSRAIGQYKDVWVETVRRAGTSLNAQLSRDADPAGSYNELLARSKKYQQAPCKERKDCY
jgi:hypothetical protein